MSPTPQNQGQLADGTTLPANTPGAAFHLGQLMALRGALALLQDVQQKGTTLPEAFETDFRASMHDCWLRFVRAIAATPAERHALESAGMPSLIRFDPMEEVPVAIWTDANTGLTNMWGLFTLPPSDPAAKGPLQIAMAFQPLQKVNLPEETRMLILRDPRHTALAALEHLLANQVGDVAQQREGVNDRTAWLRLQALCGWYGQLSRLAVEKLPHDNLRDWSEAPIAWASTDDLVEGARRIEQHGRTVVAIKALAMELSGVQFRRQLDAAERAHPRALDAAGAAMMAALTETHRGVQQQLDGLNRGCAQAVGIDPDSVDIHVDFAPDLHTLPRLALIPRSTRVAPAKLSARRAR